jgi:chemotaxis protein methyltransferase CheR
MTETDFAWLRSFLHARSGLALGADKRYLVDSRLAILCRRLSLPGLPELVQRLRQGDDALSVAVVEAMTTNETLFFRDTAPFKQFREVMLPALLQNRRHERSLRIWSAAASSGQEPYSLAMILDEMGPELAGWRIEILATDISGEIIAKARAGVYSQFEMQRGLPVQSLLKYFTQEADRWKISDKLRNMVTFRQMNLLQPSPGLGQFDIVFCRNVLIYFDLPTKSQVLNMIAQHLRPDGFLSLGAAETVIGLTDRFSIDRENRGLYRAGAGDAARTAPATAQPGIPAAAPPTAVTPLFPASRITRTA